MLTASLPLLLSGFPQCGHRSEWRERHWASVDSQFPRPELAKEKAMVSSSAKIIKPNGEKWDEFEFSICKAPLELEMNSELKAQQRELNITVTKETEDGGGWKAIIIFVSIPQPEISPENPIHLVRELEKTFSGKHTVFIAQRILTMRTQKSCTKISKRVPGDAL